MGDDTETVEFKVYLPKYYAELLIKQAEYKEVPPEDLLAKYAVRGMELQFITSK